MSWSTLSTSWHLKAQNDNYTYKSNVSKIRETVSAEEQMWFYIMLIWNEILNEKALKALNSGTGYIRRKQIKEVISDGMGN